MKQIALILGAGFSVVGGLPATGGLMDGRVHTPTRALARRVEAVREAWWVWRERNGSDVAMFLHACYRGEVQDPSPDVLSGMPIPWTWVAQYLAIRLSEPTSPRRPGNNPRYFERLTFGSKVAAHKRLFTEVGARGELCGVVTTNYDLLAEKVMRPQPVRGWPVPGFHYAGITRPQYAWGVSGPAGWADARRVIDLTGAVPLCKVHGSLNWNRLPGSQEIELYQDLRLGYRLDANPAIIAPVPETAPAAWLLPQWAEAERILRRADEWVVVGYSLPEYDVAVRLLLDAASRQQSIHPLMIDVRDPDAARIADRFSMLLPGAQVEPGSGL